MVVHKVFLISYSGWAGQVETPTQATSDKSIALFGKERKLDKWNGDIWIGAFKYPGSLDPSEPSEPEEETYPPVKVILPLLKADAETSPHEEHVTSEDTLPSLFLTTRPKTKPKS